MICNHLEVWKLKRLSSLSLNLSHGLPDYIWPGPLNLHVSRTSHNFPNCQGSPYPWIFCIILPFASNILLSTMYLFLWEYKATSFLPFNYHLNYLVKIISHSFYQPFYFITQFYYFFLYDTDCQLLIFLFSPLCNESYRYCYRFTRV